MKGRKYVMASRRKITDEEILAMRQMRWEEGLNLKEIAHATGISVPTVCRYTAGGDKNWRISLQKENAHGKRGRG